MGVTDAGLMPDHAHEVRLAPLFVLGMAQGLAVDRQAGTVSGVGLVPALAGPIDCRGIDADQDIANDELARHAVTPPSRDGSGSAGPSWNP